MAVRSVSSDSISGYHDGSGNTQDYNRQTTVNDAGVPALHRESRARALVRRPSVDFAKLTRQRSRAIIDNYFRGSSPPVLEHISKEILDKISATELGKVLLTLHYLVYTMNHSHRDKFQFLSNHFRLLWSTNCTVFVLYWIPASFL